MRPSLYVLILLGTFIALCNGYKILGVFHTPSRSHHLIGASLMQGLAERGHQVTVVSPFVNNIDIENYREIEISDVIERTSAAITMILGQREQNILQRLNGIYQSGALFAEEIFRSAKFLQLLRSNEQFDLIVMEIFMNEAMLGLSHRFQAPVVALSTFVASFWSCDVVGSPISVSYIPFPFTDFTDRMTYFERLKNAAISAIDRVYYNFVFLPKQDKLYDQQFPDPKPALDVLRKNVSLVLQNSHFTLNYPRPNVPNMIEIGGIQVNRKRKPLPMDLKDFLDSATNGAIYFSMGSNIKCQHFSNQTLTGIIHAFSTFKEKVLWKCDLEKLRVYGPNILTSDWLPQDDILAHPNVKLFITHGGLLSITEAIYHGVPLLGIPGFADQFLNIAFAAKAGYAVVLNFDQLGEKTLRDSLNTVLSNPKYAAKAKEISRRYRDQPLTPLDTAVYWVEYVIRHQGAPHMRLSAQDLSFIQYYSIDTIGALAIVGVIFSYILLKILQKALIAFVLFCFNFNVKEKVN